MSKYDKLKRLAEAQPTKEWKRDSGRAPFMPGAELMFGVDGPEGVSDYEDWGFSRRAASYIAAASPAAILELIAENEALTAECQQQARLNGMGSEREARLIAENERLAATLRDFLAMGEQYEWGRSTTGRQVLMRQARDVLREVANV